MKKQQGRIRVGRNYYEKQNHEYEPKQQKTKTYELFKLSVLELLQ